MLSFHNSIVGYCLIKSISLYWAPIHLAVFLLPHLRHLFYACLTFLLHPGTNSLFIVHSFSESCPLQVTASFWRIWSLEQTTTCVFWPFLMTQSPPWLPQKFLDVLNSAPRIITQTAVHSRPTFWVGPWPFWWEESLWLLYWCLPWRLWSVTGSAVVTVIITALVERLDAQDQTRHPQGKEPMFFHRETAVGRSWWWSYLTGCLRNKEVLEEGGSHQRRSLPLRNPKHCLSPKWIWSS